MSSESESTIFFCLFCCDLFFEEDLLAEFEEDLESLEELALLLFVGGGVKVCGKELKCRLLFFR